MGGDRRYVGRLLVGMALVTALACAGTGVRAEETALEAAERTKLEWEARKLARDIEIAGSRWSRVALVAPSATALVALIGVFVTLRRQMAESESRRREELGQREVERIRRFDARFNDIVAGLGSDTIPVRVGAIVSIRSFLRAEYAAFHEQVFLVLSANLRLEQDEDSRRLMVGAFELALRVRVGEVADSRPEVGARDDARALDLVRCRLDGARLSRLELDWANLDHSSLREANLRGAGLQRVRARHADWSGVQASEADFRKALLDDTRLQGARFRASDLRWTHFDKAILSGARFEGALLQSALFRGATLYGARFERADLNNASFVGAKLDRQAKTSIVKAFHWREARFDADVYRELLGIEQVARSTVGP